MGFLVFRGQVFIGCGVLYNYFFQHRMKQNPLNQKSYSKSLAVRRNFRHEVIERNRSIKQLSYLAYYNKETEAIIKQSRQGPILAPLPEQITVQTVSYFRRSNRNFYKTRITPEGPLDPHLTYETLCCFASKEDLSKIGNSSGMIDIFEKQLKDYLNSPYSEIRELAAITAGNHSIGKQSEIMKIVQENNQNIWVLINHVFEQRISFKKLLQYLPKQLPSVYRAVYELSNNDKDEIIIYLILSENLISLLLNNAYDKNRQIQLYSIRILGNILAEAEDYATELSHYQVIDHLLPFLSSSDWELRRDCCWLLANYVYEPGAAHQLLNKLGIMQRIMIMFRSQTHHLVRTQIYFILAHLVRFGKRQTMYRFALNENFLDQCSNDFDIFEADLTLNILNLIDHLIDLGEQFIDNESQETKGNPFTNIIRDGFIKLQIVNKTYSQNMNVSELSESILDKINNNLDYENQHV